MLAVILSLFAVIAVLAALGYALRPESHRSMWSARSALDDVRVAGTVLGSAEMHRLGNIR